MKTKERSMTALLICLLLLDAAADLKTAAENYLRASGLSDAQIQKLRNKLTGAE